MRENQPRKSIVAPILIFGICLLIAVIMLLVAVTTWVSELTGSTVYGAVIVGGFFAIVALVLYFAAVRDAVRSIQEKIDSVMHVVEIVRGGYQMITTKVNNWAYSFLSGVLRRL